MIWIKEECATSEAELLERLVGRLAMCLRAFPLGRAVAVLDDDDVVTVWDEGGMTASFWYEVSPRDGIHLHFASPVCGVTQEDRALLCERLLDPSGYEGAFTWQVENGQVSLVGALPAEELTDNLVLCMAQDVLQAAKATKVSLVERWYGEDVTETGTFRSLPKSEGPLDPVEPYRRTAFSPVRPCSVPERFRPIALEDAHMRWMDLPRGDVAGTLADLPRDAYSRDSGEDKFSDIHPLLEAKLLGQLTSLRFDLASLHEFQVSGLDRRSLALVYKNGFFQTGFEPTVGGGVCMFFQVDLCKLPTDPSDELYRVILGTGYDAQAAKVYVLGNTVGVCGHLDSRCLTNESARHLLLDTLALAEKVHDELTLGFGLKSLCRPEKDTSPDSDTEELFEED